MVATVKKASRLSRNFEFFVTGSPGQSKKTKSSNVYGAREQIDAHKIQKKEITEIYFDVSYS